MSKAQSVVEYMTTYGWMILVLAVALTVLYLLGVFNVNGVAQKALPGSCSVLRPEGPGTIAQLSLQGACLNLQPKYVAEFSSSGNTYVTSPTGCDTNVKSLAVWVYISSLPSSYYTITESCADIIQIDNTGDVLYYTNIHVIPSCLCPASDVEYGPANVVDVIKPGSWYFITANTTVTTTKLYDSLCVYSGSALNCNGYSTSHVSDVGFTYNGLTRNVVIGADLPVGNVLSGYISNLQLYSVRIPIGAANEIYAEGIGGAPIDLTALQYWWPLNGDTTDYSGNAANTIPSNILFTTNYNYQP
jgi:hypothetical protein